MLMTTLLPLLALMAPAVLQSQVEAFAGQVALVDLRLLLPACARPDFAWAPGGSSVMVRCAAPEWRVFVPVGERGAVAASVPPAMPMPAFTPRPETATPLVRRGDRVTVEVGGEGFVIGMEAIADADARDGRVALRPTSGGRRVMALVDADGRVRLRGASSVVNSR